MENRYGPRELLRFYLLAALLGGLVWGCRNYAMGIQQATLWGASGAVTAVVILFVCCYPHQQVLAMMVIPLPAWALGILMIGLDILNAGNPASANCV